MFKIVNIALIAFLFPVLVSAQGEIKITPPSPEATSVFKFSEVPVSLFTGIPSITVPIHEVNVNGLSFPIQLAYHARGIKVDELAPRVGLGWALTFGGMISRQTRGGADEMARGYLFQNYYDEVFTNVNLRARMMDAAEIDNLDMIPDQFFLDFPGNNVKFYFDQKTRGIVKQKFSDIRITYEVGEEGFDSWIVVDEVGNRYYYGESKDGTRSAIDFDITIKSFAYGLLSGLKEFPSGDEQRIRNTWHLMEIETPSGEVVEFFYGDPERPNYYRRSYDAKDHSSGELTSYFSRVESVQYQIREIKYSGGKIVFHKSPFEREDLNFSYCLDSLSILDSRENLVKAFKLDYIYTTAASSNHQLPFLAQTEPQAGKRLFLASVQEKTLAKALPPWNFDYLNPVLPSRFSNSQDAWGFYNGKPNGRFLTFFNYQDFNIDREVDSTFSRAGLLSKMILPTGGEIRFHYEANIGIPPAFISDVVTPRTNPVTKERKNAGFLKEAKYFDPENGWYSNPFQVTDRIVGQLTFEFVLPWCGNVDPEDMPGHCLYSVYLVGDGNLRLYPQSEKRTFDLPPGNYRLVVDPLSVHQIEDYRNSFFVRLFWDEEIEPLNPDPNTNLTPMLGAGCRIRRIEYFDKNKRATRKDFEYSEPNGGTSGVIFGLPNFFQRNYLGLAGAVDRYGSIPGSPLSAMQGNSVGYEFVTEYYGDVLNNTGKTLHQFTVVQDAGQYYTFPYHIPVNREWLRGKPTTTTHFSRKPQGEYQMVRRTENRYLYAGTNTPHIFEGPAPFLVEGQIAPPFVRKSERNLFYLPLLVHKANDSNEPDGSFKTYYITGGTFDLASTTEYEAVDGELKFVRRTNYEYDYEKNYLACASESVNSDGSKETNLKLYPSFYPDDHSFIAQMKLRNLVALPIETARYRSLGGEVSFLSGEIRKYNFERPALVEEVLSLKTNRPILSNEFKLSNRPIGKLMQDQELEPFSPDERYKTIVRINKHDSKGNPLQVTKDSYSPVSYVWGYNANHPIAQVHNAFEKDVAYTSFESTGGGNWNFSGSTIDDAGAPTGERVYQLNTGAISKSELEPSNTYTIMFWIKSATSSSITGDPSAMISAAKKIGTRQGGWELFEVKVTNTRAIRIAGQGQLDELRLHPEHAAMTTYTYKELVGMTSITDQNGVTTYFEYDELNRMKQVSDDRGNMTSYFDYNYARD